MVTVKLESSWKFFNMNIQKFFGNSCLGVGVFDKKGRRNTPRELFIVPLEVIEQVISQ